MTYHVFLLVCSVLFATGALMSKKLLNSAAFLALLSLSIALLFIRENAFWAGMFELSVCSGLISVLIIGAVSLVRPIDEKETQYRTPFIVFPLVLISFAIVSWFYVPEFFSKMSQYAIKLPSESNVGTFIWQTRQADIVGQIIILAAGVFMIKLIFPKKKRAEKQGLIK